MLDKIYEYGLKYCNNIRNSHYQQKKIGLYICIDSNGNYETVELMNPSEVICVPSISNTGSSSTNVIVEKYNIVLGNHDANLRDTYYMNLAHDAMSNSDKLIPLFVFLQNVRADKSLMEKIVSDITSAGIKLKSELCSFKIDGIPIETIQEILDAMMEVIPKPAEAVYGMSYITGEEKELSVTPTKFKFKYAVYDTPLAPFSKQRSTESYFQSGMEIARIGVDEVDVIKTAFEQLLNDPKHYNPFFRMMHWYDKDLNEDAKSYALFSFLDEPEKKPETDTEQSDEQAASVLKAAETIDLKHIGNVENNICHTAFCYAPCDSRYRMYGYREWNVADMTEKIQKFKVDSTIYNGNNEYCIKNLRSYLLSFAPFPFDFQKKSEFVKNIFSNNVERLIYCACEGGQIPTIFLQHAIKIAIHYIAIDKNKTENKRYTHNQYLNAISTINLYMKRKEEKMSNTNAYACGKLFAVYEKLQKDATKANNISSLFERAAKYPAQVLNKLAPLSNHHLGSSKINEGAKIYYSKMISEIYAEVDTLPQTLTAQEQSDFILGYYHQNNILYSKKEQ